MELVGARKRVMAHGAVSRRTVSVRRQGGGAVEQAGAAFTFVPDDDETTTTTGIALPGVSSRYRSIV